MSDIKDTIEKVVNNRQGITSVELVLEVMHQSTFVAFPDEEYNKALMQLINDGDIVEVEYTLPQMDYRVKSWYLPKNTMVQVSRKAS